MDKHDVRRLLVRPLLLLFAVGTPLLSYGEVEVATSGVGGERTEHRFPMWKGKDVLPKLYDARGNLIGEIVVGSADSDDGGVVLSVNGVLVYAGFSRISKDGDFTRSATQMRWNDREPRYGGPNCSGAAYIVAPNSALRPVAMVRKGAQVTLLIAVDGRAEDHTLASELDGGNCVGNYSLVDSVWRVESTLDLTEKYPEPLRVGL